MPRLGTELETLKFKSVYRPISEINKKYRKEDLRTRNSEIKALASGNWFAALQHSFSMLSRLDVSLPYLERIGRLYERAFRCSYLTKKSHRRQSGASWRCDSKYCPGCFAARLGDLYLRWRDALLNSDGCKLELVRFVYDYWDDWNLISGNLNEYSTDVIGQRISALRLKISRYVSKRGFSSLARFAQFTQILPFVSGISKPFVAVRFSYLCLVRQDDSFLEPSWFSDRSTVDSFSIKSRIHAHSTAFRYPAGLLALRRDNAGRGRYDGRLLHALLISDGLRLWSSSRGK